MKILIALDDKDYSRNILKDVARLAENTLADLVFLGVQADSSRPAESLKQTLERCRQDVYNYFSPEDLPYADFSGASWREQGPGDWIVSDKGMKECTLRIRAGGAAAQITATAADMECDLVVMGCGGEFGCEWDGEMNVPLRVAEDAPCSVLVIKQSGGSGEIVSILDQSKVSQDSLEMVNQLVTLFDAGLKIVGVSDRKSKTDEIEQRMVQLLRYYNDRQVSAWVQVLDSEKVRDLVASASRNAVIALWMGGKQSLIKRLFSRNMVDRLLETTQSSLFILR